ncbi:MAG: hypothetical protein HOL07_00300 [Rhodospirillaceae bacterium]|nr:hypothetical protein [Rhodospirillaceae bacterium]MBT4771463.1 hypothetical protein [Rhodospirillaceae bacterium]MBT5356762.1 hypothetical protein [Rhodospirillaceae bacterium]MBT5770755.1 hypothetical protein [Rhodospirillaceae bacterium]MBT6311243.1 hypothetical protein [Rhodospirillaceae bacterium]
MRKFGLMAVFVAPLFSVSLATSPAQAEPQMLGVVQTASAVPLHCTGGNCTAELSSICLHEQRATPTSGHPYTAFNADAISVTGTRADGTQVSLRAADVLKFAAARGFHTVRVDVPDAVRQAHGLVALAVKVEQPLTLIPGKSGADSDDPLTDADIELGAGPMRATATAIVDRNGDTMHAGQILARMIDALPRHGRADTEARAGLWDTAAVSHVPSHSRTGVHKARTAYNRCYRQTRIGDKNLRGCLAEAHDGLVLDLNQTYWDAVKAGS